MLHNFGGEVIIRGDSCNGMQGCLKYVKDRKKARKMNYTYYKFLRSYVIYIVRVLIYIITRMEKEKVEYCKML